MLVTEDEDIVARSEKNIKGNPKKRHRFAENVENNETNLKRHNKQ